MAADFFNTRQVCHLDLETLQYRTAQKEALFGWVHALPMVIVLILSPNRLVKLCLHVTFFRFLGLNCTDRKAHLNHDVLFPFISCIM